MLAARDAMGVLGPECSGRCRESAPLLPAACRRGGAHARLGNAGTIMVVMRMRRHTLAQQLCRISVGADLKAEGAVHRGHEARWNQRAYEQGNQQRADDPLTLLAADDRTHDARESITLEADRRGSGSRGSSTSTVTCERVGTCSSFSLK